jgi:hypothetical protein
MCFMVTLAHHGVLTERKKSFFSSLATRFRRQSLSSKPLSR